MTVGMRPWPNDQQREGQSGFPVAGVIIATLLGLAAMLVGLAFDHHAAGSWAAAIGFFTCCAAIFYVRFIRGR